MHINFGLIHVPFQLFEMGLELSLDRLKALAKFAFGMGLTQVMISLGTATLVQLCIEVENLKFSYNSYL